MMARTSIRKAVINKINEKMTKWPNYKKLSDINAKIGRCSDLINIEKRINEIINSIRICDPAVGSGHFLVSALNEIIAIKSKLGIILVYDGKDASGRNKYKQANFQCRIEHDELVTRIHGKVYHYHVKDVSRAYIQQTLFREKETIIKNCLFGVDINPNSTQICRLRLWIELLKNAYYYHNNKCFTAMPNIDINIKTRNSLVYSCDLKFKTNISNKEFKEYRDDVKQYKKADTKVNEYDLKEAIQDIKDKATSAVITPNRNKYKRDMHKYSRKLNKLSENETALPLNNSKSDRTKVNILLKEKLADANYKLSNQKYQYDRHHKDPFYKKAMEWRIEFPEVLDDNGCYDGFDVVISNPPYVFTRNKKIKARERDYYINKYTLAKYQLNTYHIFIELAFKILKNKGIFAFIVPNNMLTIQKNVKLRKFLINNTNNLILINSLDNLFKGANVNNCIIYADKDSIKNKNKNCIKMYNLHDRKIHPVAVTPHNFFSLKDEKYSDEPIFSFERAKHYKLMSIYRQLSNSIQLKDIANVWSGIKAYEKGEGIGHSRKNTLSAKDCKNRIYHSATKKNSFYDKYLSGADVSRYSINWGSKRPKEKWIKYGKNLAAMRDPNHFKGTRILVRQIINKSSKYSIPAEIITKNNVINDMNIMIIQSINEKKYNSYFILGVINSNIMTMWFAMKFDKFQRTIDPQFKINELKEFPVPNASKNQQKHVSFLVKSIIYEKHTKDRPKEINKLNLDIDEYVMKLFGIKGKNIDLVNNFKL